MVIRLLDGKRKDSSSSKTLFIDSERMRDGGKAKGIIYFRSTYKLRDSLMYLACVHALARTYTDTHIQTYTDTQRLGPNI